MFICIYCGFYSEEFLDFRYKLKDGTYSRKMVTCPECEIKMQKETLTMDIEVEEWARLLYYSIRVYKEKHNPEKDFFHKIKWDKLKKNLKQLGIAQTFWDAWKDVKSECEGITDFNYYLSKLIEIQGKAKVKKLQQSLLAPKKYNLNV